MELTHHPQRYHNLMLFGQTCVDALAKGQKFKIASGNAHTRKFLQENFDIPDEYFYTTKEEAE